MTVPKPPSVTKLRRQRYLSELEQPLPKGPEQLDLWANFVGGLPAEYTGVLELFDAAPKFYAGAVTSSRQGGTLDIVERPWVYNDHELVTVIKPIILPPRRGDVKNRRREVIAAEREETVYRVLRKMASDPDIKRVSGEKSVSIICSLYEIRRRLAAIARGLTIEEIREALEVLDKTALEITDRTARKRLYAGGYISLKFVGDADDPEGQRTLCEITFNDLAARAIINGYFDRIHYAQLMSLKTSLAQWLYEHLTRNFRQAASGIGYDIQLSRIIRESPMRPYAELRKAVEKIREALADLQEHEVLAAFPQWNESIDYAPSIGGRRSIREITWTLFLADKVVKDIRADNAAHQMRNAGRIRAP